MLYFILYHYIFDITIQILLIINLVLTSIIDYKNNKNESYKNLSTIQKTKLALILIHIFLVLILLYIKFNTLLKLLIYFIIPSILLIKNLLETYTKEQKLTIDKKYSLLWASYIFIIFFSSRATSIYYSTLSNISQIFKEIFLILYLLTKIIVFTYIFITNITILISNINILKPLSISQENNNQYYKIKDYNYLIYNKYKNIFSYIIDTIVYIIICPLIIGFNLIALLFIKCIINIKRFFNLVISKTINFNENKTIITRRITNISIIAAFSIVQIITILNKDLFSIKTTEIYNFLSTVILIPFIYDYIKSN